MEETDRILQKVPSQEINYFNIFKIVISRWYWIAGAVAVSMIAANVYLWYTPKTYATSSTMKFEEKKSEYSDLVSITGASDRSTSRIQSETIVLQSYALLHNAIKHIDYRFSFYLMGRVINRTSELYPLKPIDIELIKFDSLNFFHDLITFKPVGKNTFTLSYENSGKEFQRTCYYNTPIIIGPTAFSIKYSDNLSSSSVYLFRINTPDSFIDRVRGGLHTAETTKNSNIISLQQTDLNPQFAADVLNAVMKEYLNYDRNQRRQSALQMIQFIDSQLDFLSHEVKNSENSIEQYKHKSKIMDFGSASEQALGKAKDFESQRSVLKIQLLAIDQLKGEIIKEKDNVNLNFNVGIDQQVGDYISTLNNLMIEKVSLLKTYNNDSQIIHDIDLQILKIKNNAVNSINASHLLIQNKLQFLEEQLLPVNQQIAGLPSVQRDLIGLQRDFEINDKVYSFLSEKKLDAQINSAGILPGATIIDLAQPNFNPISPDRSGIQKTSIILGLIIGLGLIILIRVLHPYIYDKETIETLTNIPIIGVIRKFPEEIDEFSTQILAIQKPKSLFAESVRSVRTNLSFLATGKKSKMICITSEVAGEGKSFVAVNLSSTLSLIDKKVILIAADLRRSKLHKTFNVPNDLGLSNYLAHQCNADDIINHSSQANFDFITSGPVPPNPSELLHTNRMSTLITDLKLRYDIVMIDTAPIGLVSDAIPLIRMSDINLFVIRSGKSKLYAATVPQRIAQEYHLDNTVIVLNAYAQDSLHSRYYTSKLSSENYNTRYYYYSDFSGYENSGYYVDEKDKKWWEIWLWLK